MVRLTTGNYVDTLLVVYNLVHCLLMGYYTLLARYVPNVFAKTDIMNSYVVSGVTWTGVRYLDKRHFTIPATIPANDVPGQLFLTAVQTTDSQRGRIINFYQDTVSKTHTNEVIRIIFCVANIDLTHVNIKKCLRT